MELGVRAQDLPRASFRAILGPGTEPPCSPALFQMQNPLESLLGSRERSKDRQHTGLPADVLSFLHRRGEHQNTMLPNLVELTFGESRVQALHLH